MEAKRSPFTIGCFTPSPLSHPRRSTTPAARSETDEFNHTVDIVGDEGLGRYSFVHLELVTPVEELEPYTVVESYGRTDVMKGDYIIATYTDSHPHAKEAAEAERDRLNAEYRKEQNND